MHTASMSDLTRPLEVEWELPTLWDSAPAVLYRVGRRVDPYDANRRLSDAEEEAITPRYIRRLDSTRRRHLVAVAVEEPRDLVLPIHKRPALMRAFGLSSLLTGGLLIEARGDLGSVEDADLLLLFASFFSGQLPRFRTMRDFEDLPGTVTVGHLGESAGKRRAQSTEFNWLTEETVRYRRAMGRVADAMGTSPMRECVAGLMATVIKSYKEPSIVVRTSSATSSELFCDLTAEGAQEYVRACRSAGAGADRIVRALRLFGFINPAGHRTWSKADLSRLERNL